MHDLIVVLDFLSRAFAVLLLIGGLLSFLARRWIGAWIDARFKRQVDSELKALEHRFALMLEDRKTALAKELVAETERLKAGLAKDLEREKRELEEEFRRRAHVFDKNAALYETFQLEYGAIFAEMYALDGDYIETANRIHPELGKTLRSTFLAKAHRRLVEAQEKLAPHEGYAGAERTRRMAKLFADLSAFMADDAADRKRLDQLALEKGMIAVELRSELLGTVT